MAVDVILCECRVYFIQRGVYRMCGEKKTMNKESCRDFNVVTCWTRRYNILLKRLGKLGLEGYIYQMFQFLMMFFLYELWLVTDF